MIDQIKMASRFAHKDKSHYFSNICVIDGLVQCQDFLSGITLQVDSDINFCCNAAKLNQVVSKCDPANTKFELKAGNLEIKSGRIKAKIETIPVGNYPFFTQEDHHEFEIDIIEDLKNVSVFTSPDDVRVFMQGVIIDKNAIFATNGHVVVKKEIELETDIQSIIPTKSIIKFHGAKLDCGKISISEKSVEFIFNGGRMFTRKIASKSPDINRMIGEVKNPISVDDFIEDLKIINSMCSDDKTIIIGKHLETRDGSAKIEDVNLPDCAFNSDYLINVCEISTHIDLSNFPEPCQFEGDGIKGVLAGIRI